jgi:type I restriction enzyme S subunit
VSGVFPETAFEDLFAVPLRNGLTRPRAVRGSGVKMVNMGELFAHPRISDVPMERVPLSSEEAETYLLHEGDLLFARQSLVLAGAGKCSIFLGASEPITFEGHLMRVRLDKKKADPLFCYYFFSSNNGKDSITSIVEQVAAAGIRGRDLARLNVPRPPLPEQHAIAHILGTLDDKIELNRKMNETLEAITRAIFKSWFVDFDLVRAKAEGRDTGLPREIADLFPSEFEESELGMMPRGWRVGSVSDIARVQKDSINPSPYPNEEFDHYSIPAFDDGRWPKKERGEEIKSNKFLVPAGAVLLSKLNPRFPRVWLPDVSVEGRSICSTEFLVALPKEGSTREYLYGLFTSKSFADVFATLVTGTSSSHQRVKSEYLGSMKVILPTLLVVQAFSERCRAVFEQISSSLRESRLLAFTRDALLPKLLSGELRIHDTDRFLKEAGV